MENAKNEAPKGKPVVLLSWVAPERFFIPKKTSWFIGLGVLIASLCLFLMLVREWTLAIFFLVFGIILCILYVVEPDLIEFQILSTGFRIGNRNYGWKDLEFFWLGDKGEKTLLFIKTKLYLPDRLEAILEEVDPAEVEKIFSEHLPYREEKTNDFYEFLDGVISGVSSRLPLKKAKEIRPAPASPAETAPEYPDFDTEEAEQAETEATPIEKEPALPQPVKIDKNRI